MASEAAAEPAPAFRRPSRAEAALSLALPGSRLRRGGKQRQWREGEVRECAQSRRNSVRELRRVGLLRPPLPRSLRLGGRPRRVGCASYPTPKRRGPPRRAGPWNRFRRLRPLRRTVYDDGGHPGMDGGADLAKHGVTVCAGLRLQRPVPGPAATRGQRDRGRLSGGKAPDEFVEVEALD